MPDIRQENSWCDHREKPVGSNQICRVVDDSMHWLQVLQRHGLRLACMLSSRQSVFCGRYTHRPHGVDLLLPLTGSVSMHFFGTLSDVLFANLLDLINCCRSLMTSCSRELWTIHTTTTAMHSIAALSFQILHIWQANACTLRTPA